jgi:drug/metabolite transporter (DMT)-like permease
MVAIIFGLLTATFFATSSLCNARASRHMGSWAVVGWAMLIGLLLTIPLVVIGGIPSMDAATIAWLAISGLGNVGGLILTSFAYRMGKVGVISPIIATEGAIAAIISAAFGAPIAPLVILTLTVIVIGVIMAGVAPDPAPLAHARPVLAVILAIACAFAFGLSLFATGHLSGGLPVGMLLIPARLIGVIVLAAPLTATRRFQLSRKAAPLVIGMGIAEVVGFICYTIAAASDIAIASVLVSQFAPIATLAAFFLFKERLGRLQILGFIVIIVGVVGLSAVQATS